MSLSSNTLILSSKQNYICHLQTNCNMKCRMKALILGRPYMCQESIKNQKCVICGCRRANLSAHLLRVHSVSKKSPELKGFGTKIQATKRIADGKYSSVEDVLEKYSKEYFRNLDGARRSLKPETDAKYKKKKLVTVRKALYWLIDRTKETELNALMSKIRCLGEEKTGYFDLFGKVNSSKGNFCSYIHKPVQIHCVNFFCRCWFLD